MHKDQHLIEEGLIALIHKLNEQIGSLEAYLEEETDLNVGFNQVVFRYMVENFGFGHAKALAEAVDKHFAKTKPNLGQVDYVETEYEQFDQTSPHYVGHDGRVKPTPSKNVSS